MAVNYTLVPVFIKANSTRLHTFCICPVEASIHPDRFSAYDTPVVLQRILSVGATKLVYRSESTWLVFIHEQPFSVPGIYLSFSKQNSQVRDISFLDLLSTVIET